MSELKKISSLYIHFPYCRNLCNYCDFYKTKKKNYKEYNDFHQLMEKSFHEHKKLLVKYGYEIGRLKTLYIGGGTPSLWGKEGAGYLKSFLSDYFYGFEDEYEFTLEMNPDEWNEEDLALWKKIGVNRISVGIQSLDPLYFKWLDRGHKICDAMRTLEYLKRNGWNYTIDLMLGLSNMEGVRRNIISEIEQVLDYGPKHFSLYILTPKGNYPESLKQNLPHDEYIRKEYLEAASFLKSKGYSHYEVSNFAQKGFESQHNLAYWNLESVMALGPCAAGFLAGENDQMPIRYKWKAGTTEMVVEHLSKSEKFMENLYLGLRTSRGFDWNLLPESTFEIFQELMTLWLARGYILESSPKLKLSSLGFLMLDSIMDDIFKKIELP